MAETNPIARLYDDTEEILRRLVIKYSAQAEKYETLVIKEKAGQYLNALLEKDDWYTYDDYTLQDFLDAKVPKEDAIRYFEDFARNVPNEIRNRVVRIRRARTISSYEEKNNYYRMLNGYPDVEDKDFIYVRKDVCEEYGIPEDLPVHLIGDTMGSYYVLTLESIGYFDLLVKEYPERGYLKHLGSARISIADARRAKNFEILYLAQSDITESTYIEFIRSYEKCRIYFMSTAYIYQYRQLIPYYDNFIALCIFVMTIQQVSMRAVQNAVYREFYDEYMVQLLYEQYSVPYFSKVDHGTQKKIVQNLNLLVQNKATDKCILDIASILGFNEISIYQYYLMKRQLFDKNGHPLMHKTQKVNTTTGQMEEVYDYEKNHDLYFQKVDIREKNVKDALTDSLNRVEYNEVTYYDPFWWEDDELYNEIWKTQYNFMETKYMGITIPYRLTEVLFESIILLRMILENGERLQNVTLRLPMISEKEIPLKTVVMLYLALMAKKHGYDGQILDTPSKIIHYLEVTDQAINKETDELEVLSFNFDAFKPENIEKTKGMMERFLARREYRIVNGHDVDLREDGTQDIFAPTHLVSFDINREDLDEFYSYISLLAIPEVSPKDKIAALNKIYENSTLLCDFLSYQMSVTNNYEEYYAIKTFYDTVFYRKETKKMYEVETEDGMELPKTFLEYLEYADKDLYLFVRDIKKDRIYEYIDHIIFKMEELGLDVGHLYLRNDGFSPLMELLKILVTFFKSYALDFVQLSTLMVIDWELENTVRFFSHPQHIHKVDEIETRFGKDFMDLVHNLLVHYRIEDKIAISEYLKIHGNIHLEDATYVHDALEYIRMRKVDAIKSEIRFYDTNRSTHGSLKVNSDIFLEDFCIKKE